MALKLMADWSGLSVSSAGDVNGDGLDDLIVGAEGANPSGRSNSGKSYVVFCRVACISNGTQINGTAVGFAKHNIRFTCI
jgi:hypothetical protein